jgi:hypothetical protein
MDKMNEKGKEKKKNLKKFDPPPFNKVSLV